MSQKPSKNQLKKELIHSLTSGLHPTTRLQLKCCQEFDDHE